MRRRNYALGAGVLTLSVAACNSILGIEEHPLAPPLDGSPTVDASEAGPVVDGGNDAGSDAAATDAGADASSVCTDGALRCSANTPQKCVAGVWTNQTACGGSTPVCSNGACGTYRTTGGLRSVGPTPAADAGIHLVAGGFELRTRTCTDGGVCVTGGISP